MSLSKKEKIGLFIYLIIIVTSGMRSPYFYLNWILGLIVIVYSGFKIIFRGRLNFSSVKLFIISTLWLIGPILSAFFGKNVNMMDNFKYIFVYIYQILLSIIFLKYINDLSKVKLNKIFYFVNIMWLSIALLSLILNSHYSFLPKKDFSGILVNRNEFAIYTTIFSSYLLFNEHEYKSKLKLKLILFFSLFVVISTASIKGVLGWMLIYLLYSHKKKLSINKLMKILVLIIIVPLILRNLILNEHALVERISRFLLVSTDKQSLRANESAFLRVFYFKEGIKVFCKNPLIGIGVKNSKYFLIPPIKRMQGYSVGTYSHNGYIEMLLNGGIVSFLLYYGLLIKSLIRLLSKHSYGNNTEVKFAWIGYNLMDK